MALVAYEFSDGSDAEIEPDDKTVENEKILPSSANLKTTVSNFIDEEEVEIIRQASKNNINPPEESESSDEEEEPIKVTFSNLPMPSFHAFSTYEPKTKNLKLTSLAKVIPIRSQSQKNEPRNGPKLNFNKDTGLLSVLPKPENESSAEVSSVFKFSSKLIPTAAKTANASKPKNETTKTPSVSKMNNDDDDIGSDFFSLSKDRGSEDIPIDMNIDLPDIKSDKPINHFPQPNPLLAFNDRNDTDSQAVPEDTDSSQTLQDLDEEMLQKIRGRKRKGQIPENIQIIDINEAEILAESKKVSEKHFTDEVMCNPAPKKCSSSSTLSKRKHQITYLAFQAKERELELKNQWATNRATRKQTQSKYGF